MNEEQIRNKIQDLKKQESEFEKKIEELKEQIIKYDRELANIQYKKQELYYQLDKLEFNN